MKQDDLEKRLRAPGDGRFALASFDPRDAGDLDKGDAADRLQKSRDRLHDLQERLYAEARWSVLVVIQGMDTSGKDGVIDHVMSGINPQGLQVTSFKGPSTAELRHDFLWRCVCALPERGRIGIFNRSYYEDVLVVRVHGDLLEKASLPKERVTDRIWKERYESIRAFERHLSMNGTLVLKFFLHLSRDEQRQRFLDRIDQPDKNWKFNAGDIAERARWDDYVRAYEEAIAHTGSDDAPWYIVPADRKWFARLAVAEIIASRLQKIDPRFPVLGEAAHSALQQARAQLLAESD